MMGSNRPANIAINAHLLSLADSYRGAGIHRYITALLEHLPQVSEHRFTAYLGDPRAGDVTWPGIDARLAPFSTASPPARALWEQLFQPAHLVRDNIDLLHGPAYALPLICPTRSVVTIHDLSFFLYPQTFNRGNRLYLRLMTYLAARRADAVIAVSEHTRQDVIRLLDVPADHVHAVPNGIDSVFRPLPEHEVQRFRAEHQLPKRFVLCISTIEPRKNLATLIRAYATLGNTEHRLIIGGGRGWKYESIFALVDELGLRDRIWFPGFVRHSELPHWYNAADAFVFPSIYEGFGLPPLEAMACGTPVIASNASSLPEVVGSAGLLVDPTDVAALADAIHQVLRNPELAATMSAQGLTRADRFSWKASAERTAAVYERILDTQVPQGAQDAITR
jgi:glycosyltransferase involved in cell wall biosynthesis